jgi:hypothetical protein
VSDLAFCYRTGAPLREQWPQEALDGEAARKDSVRLYENPHSAFREPEKFAAWRDGWEFADDEEMEDDDGEDDC